MGMRIYSDVAIDDFSLSPECFGLNIPVDELNGYNYYDPKLFDNRPAHRDFVNKTGKFMSTLGTFNIIHAQLRSHMINIPPTRFASIWVFLI